MKKYHLSLLLSLAGSLLTFSAARAQDNDQVIGLNAPHQERNPSQHPELFSNPALRGQQQRQPAEPRAGKVAAARRRALFIAANTVVVTASAPTTTGVSRGADLPFEDLVGANAPRQERNPSFHPELFGATQRP